MKDSVEDGVLIGGIVDGFCLGQAAGWFGSELYGDGGAGEIVEGLEESAADDDGDRGVIEGGVDVRGEAHALVDVGGLCFVPRGCRSG